MATQTALYSTNIDNVFNQFVSVASTATRSQYSIDGTVWTALTLTSYPALTDLTYGNGLAVALGQTVNTANMIYTAATPTALAGQGWIARTVAATGIANIGWQAVAFGNNIYCAVGGGIDATIRTSSTAAVTSTDTTTWAVNAGLTAADWRCLCYAESKFVTLSYGSNLIRYSTDGITWSSDGSGLPKGYNLHMPSLPPPPLLPQGC